MAFPLHSLPPSSAPQPPAEVRSATRMDVLWNRPIFKAPPLKVNPPLFDASIFTHDLKPVGLVQH